MKSTETTRNGDIVTMHTPDAKFTIIYGMHIRGLNPKQIPSDLDAIFLETGTHPWYEKPLECINDLKNHIQYKPIFQTLEHNKIPIILGDLKYKYNDALLLLADNALSAGTWVTGINLNHSTNRTSESF